MKRLIAVAGRTGGTRGRVCELGRRCGAGWENGGNKPAERAKRPRRGQVWQAAKRGRESHSHGPTCNEDRQGEQQPPAACVAGHQAPRTQCCCAAQAHAAGELAAGAPSACAWPGSQASTGDTDGSDSEAVRLEYCVGLYLAVLRCVLPDPAVQVVHAPPAGGGGQARRRWAGAGANDCGTHSHTGQRERAAPACAASNHLQADERGTLAGLLPALTAHRLGSRLSSRSGAAACQSRGSQCALREGAESVGVGCICCACASGELPVVARRRLQPRLAGVHACKSPHAPGRHAAAPAVPVAPAGPAWGQPPAAGTHR